MFLSENRPSKPQKALAIVRKRPFATKDCNSGTLGNLTLFQILSMGNASHGPISGTRGCDGDIKLDPITDALVLKRPGVTRCARWRLDSIPAGRLVIARRVTLRRSQKMSFASSLLDKCRTGFQPVIHERFLPLDGNTARCHGRVRGDVIEYQPR